MGNDPVSSIDPDGQWAHIAIGAVVGGFVNLGIEAYKGKVTGLNSGLAAFGVGAVAGGVGAATFGAGVAVASGGTAISGIVSSAAISSGAGGFGAGLGAGMASGMLSSGIQTVGNAVLLGDFDRSKSLMDQTVNSMIMGGITGAITGGLSNGVSAWMNGKDFWTGVKPDIRVVYSPTPTRTIHETMKEVVAVGKRGEQAVGVSGLKPRIPSLTGTADYRVPDIVSKTTLEEVKNVKYLSLTNQLKDYNLFSKQEGLQMILHTRSNTNFSAPLQKFIQENRILIKHIPLR
jgi:hypothetical protein